MTTTVPTGIQMGLLQQLSEHPHTFLQPTPDIATSALVLVKELLDPLATDVADVQKTRRDQSKRKRKRGEDDGQQVLQLRKVYTNGLGVRQVWEQAKRILEAACDEVQRELPEEEEVMMNGDGYSALEGDQQPQSEGSGDDDIFDEELDTNFDDDKEEDEDQETADFGEDDIEEIEDETNVSEDSEVQPEIYVPDPNGLNDGFFSIDDFNKQSQFMEQMDARGDDDNRSDEEEIDWGADPLSTASSRSHADPGEVEQEDKGEEGDEGKEDGPTFGNADLNASDSEDELDDDAVDDMNGDIPALNNTNDVRYADFFEPPPKKLSKTKRMRALPKTQPPKGITRREEDDDNPDLDADIQRAINDVNRDILASESEVSDNDDSDAEALRTKNMSSHEKQRAKIAAEIRLLEAANVAKRDWTLSGEARAADRPVNSLIEEDLEFERVGKPVPVVTAETTEEIEALIKRRIIAREFDEVVRRRPDAIGASSEARRGRVEVDDRKAEAGLAEIYEQEHLKSTDPNYIDKRSAATKKHHSEIDKLWKEVSYQLDLLSNLHFKPKRITVEIKTIEDKPTISMEDARPVGDVGESMLAPQEVYKAGEDRRKDGEVTRRGGASINKEEMSREEKVRKRRREKERLKKQHGSSGSVAIANGKKKGKKTKGEEKQDILADLRKGNVKVIGKKGDLQSLAKKRERGDAQASSSALKL